MIDSELINQIQKILKDKDDSDRVITCQIAPAVRVAIGEYFGQPPGTNVVNKLVHSLKQIGFNYVFDTNFGADLTIMEEAAELVRRIRTNKLLPMFTTCCPTWYNFVERLYPDFIPYLSTVKSPQAMLGSIVKTYFADKIGMSENRVIHIVIAPCMVKKEEAKKKELYVHQHKNIPNIDYVLTTNEAAILLQRLGIDLSNMQESKFDNPLGVSSGAGAIFGTTGGVIEAVIRTAYYLLEGVDLENYELIDIRNTVYKKTGKIKLGNYDLNIVTVNSLREIKLILDELKKESRSKYQFVEVMACPLGCVGGSGQPTCTREILEKRRRALFTYDKRHQIRVAHKNPYIEQLYSEFLGGMGSEKAKSILHTHYIDKSYESGSNEVCRIS